MNMGYDLISMKRLIESEKIVIEILENKLKKSIGKKSICPMCFDGCPACHYSGIIEG